MGSLTQKTLMDWDQPRRVRRFLAAKEGQRSPWWVRPLWVAATVGAFVLLWYLSGRKIAASLAVGVALVIALFLVYVAPFLYGLVPSVVKIMEKEIRVSEGSSVAQWPYESIERCEILPVECQGETAHVLSVTLADGAQKLIVVAPEVSLDELRGALAQHGVAVESTAGATGA